MAAENGKNIIASDERSALNLPGQVGSIFADGVGMVQVSTGVSKLLFYKIGNIETREQMMFENREVIFELVMPTQSLFAWISSFLLRIEENMPVLEKSTQDALDAIKIAVASNKK